MTGKEINKYTAEGEEMTKAETLKNEILKHYRSIRKFALEMGIPYSTLVTALERGIEGMAYGTVIKMCDKLSLNPINFDSLEKDASLGAQLLENHVMQYYLKLNDNGKTKILGLMDDFVQIDKYKIKGRRGKHSS
jgi:hypothetical protein